ncbi:unnamed protein product [Soboliphyme baturini]|uniref:Golgin-45 n=1 Tax=Soboliphyme baturini TaxID=241478 RepID=A0A183IV00_9BILA|nr:unnamed protein product [Soboliphyme baturini]
MSVKGDAGKVVRTESNREKPEKKAIARDTVSSVSRTGQLLHGDPKNFSRIYRYEVDTAVMHKQHRLAARTSLGSAEGHGPLSYRVDIGSEVPAVGSSSTSSQSAAVLNNGCSKSLVENKHAVDVSCDGANEWRLKYDRLVDEHERTLDGMKRLREQVDLQTNVNSELKKLLVATMGSELQVKLECLTEEKVKLSEHLLNCNRQLSADREAKDSLSIQSDVWRTKFLASCTIIEEIAACYSRLLSVIDESKKTLRTLLDDHAVYRRRLLEAVT